MLKTIWENCNAYLVFLYKAQLKMFDLNYSNLFTSYIFERMSIFFTQKECTTINNISASIFFFVKHSVWLLFISI